MIAGKFMLVALLVTTISKTSCKKNQDGRTDAKDLVGVWEWVRTDGGFGFHIHHTPASTGKQIELKVGTDNKYSFYVNGVLKSEGTFTISLKQSIVDQKNKRFIDFSDPNDQDQLIFRVDNGVLELTDNYHDGTGSQYKKK